MISSAELQVRAVVGNIDLETADYEELRKIVLSVSAFFTASTVNDLVWKQGRKLSKSTLSRWLNNNEASLPHISGGAWENCTNLMRKWLQYHHRNSKKVALEVRFYTTF